MITKTNGAAPDNQCTYDEAFKAEALRMASECRSPPGLAEAKLEISYYIAYYKA